MPDLGLRLTAITTIDHPALEDADEVANACDADLVNSLTTQETTHRLLANGANEHRTVAHYQDLSIYLLLLVIAIALIGWVACGADIR